MPASVEKYIRTLMRSGMPKSEAIAIGKKQGKIQQNGKHLAEGPAMAENKAKPKK